MKEYEEFDKFLEYAEAHDWKLEITVLGNYRSFIYIPNQDVLPFICKVSNKKVSLEYVERFKEIVAKIEGESGESKP